ncbi:hypothetical protein AYL99_06898 [Fonsecaea erecta]|uniref:Heterokaryon incompatibility domain-containing protein n=1 Tax=Fonsecaea erecta TaxID=1367422 RepID=A0A178ZII6_9EURO|nr:hypothetical protein AYL99_06898 [Fonsecaea erecta]OAP59600.1 hypothetical protein AYL99_06898 [Fonsecaea erecta]
MSSEVPESSEDVGDVTNGLHSITINDKSDKTWYERWYEEESDEPRTPLASAAKAGNVDLVAKLLAEADVDVDVRDYIGCTPLALAAMNGHAAVVAQLLAAGANPNLRDLNYVAPLWHAALFGHVAVVRQLLTCGRLLDVNPRPLLFFEHDTETPLAVALKKGHRDTAELLASANGIDPSAKTKSGCDGDDEVRLVSILELAVQAGYEDIALALLNKCHAMNISAGLESGEGNFDEEGAKNATRNAVKLASKLLVAAADAGCYRISQELLTKHGADVNLICRYCSMQDNTYHEQSPLMAASSRGHKRIVRLLLDAEGIQPDLCSDYGSTALIQVAKKGLLDVMKMLLADARVNADQRDKYGRTALSYAAEHAREALVAELLANENVEPDSTDSQARTPLMWALSPESSTLHGTSWRPDKARQAVVRRLLASRRVNPNSRDDSGYTPLIYAVKCGSVDLVSAILEHPQTDKKAGRMNTALAIAADRGQADMVQVLLDKGQVDVNATHDNYPQGTPLTLAAGWGSRSNTVRTLLSAPGIDPNGKNQYGNTPLHGAASVGNVEIAKQLLAAAGIDPNIQNQQGRTALHNATLSWSSVAESAEVMKALLKAPNINADLADKMGRTPLSIVAQAGKVELLDILLTANGVDPDSRDEAGRSPLSWVLEFDRYDENFEIEHRKEAVRHLLRIAAVDPNAEDAEGLTPLLRAIQCYRGSEFVRLLTKRADLDVNKRGPDGLTPLALAKEKGDTVTIALLRACGAIAPDEDPLTIGIILPDDPALSESSDYTGRHSMDESTAAEHRPGVRLSNRLHDKKRKELAREYQLFLGEQQQYIGELATENTASLCPVCSTIDLDAVFRSRHTEYNGRTVAYLGRIDDTWEERACPLCRLIAAVRPRSGTDLDCVLVSFSTTQSWLCHDELMLWDLFEFNDTWVDTMALGVIDLSDWGITALSGGVNNVFSAGFISRLGSNCPDGEKAVSVPRLAADGSDLRMSTARDWIKCCRLHHGKGCNPPRLASVPHFRLVECTTRRIVEQDPEVGAPPPYVALSYVWGQPPRWQQQSLDDTVEPVIEDAIRVTLELGYEYLWVDRYCIVQTGNEAIKNTQMRNMHNVFSNADVTLVAAAGKDASTGLLGAPGRPRPFQQPSALVQGHALVCVPPDPSLHIRSASTWSTRGWTYQEGLLARRRLYFSEFEMSYECRNMLVRETIRLPASKEKYMTNYGHKPRLMEPFWLYQPFRRVGLKPGSDTSDFFDLLQEYSGRQLSLPSDTLNAMLGILQLLAEPDEDEPLYHVCGVPILHVTIHKVDRSILGISVANADEVALDGFINGLCWTLERPARRRPDFPSWSWTGWQGVVSRMSWTPGVHKAYGLDLDVSIGPRDQDGPLVPWNRYYEQLRTADESSKDLWTGQSHILEITASAVTVRFRRQGSSGAILKGTVCVGDYVWQGDFSPNRKEDDNSPGDNGYDSNDNDTFSPHAALLQKPWTGIVLGRSYPISHMGRIQTQPEVFWLNRKSRPKDSRQVRARKKRNDETGERGDAQQDREELPTLPCV